MPETPSVSPPGESGTDVYRAPQSELTDPIDASEIQAALDRAAAGDFEFRPLAVISESWALISGAKLPILLGIIASYVISFLVQMAGALVWAPAGDNVGMLLLHSLVLGLLQTVATTPIWGGLLYMAIQRADGESVSPNDIGSQFQRAGPLIATALLMMVMIYVGLVLLVIPGIYLSVAYLLALPLVVDKGLGPLQAMEASRKAISRCWFRMFGLILLVGLILAAGTLLLLVGLIWAAPLAVVTFGVAYRCIFGISHVGDRGAVRA